MTIDQNMGRADQIVRLIIGALMLSMIAFVPESGWWGLLGLVPISTAVFRHCPAYTLAGVKTNRRPG